MNCNLMNMHDILFTKLHNKIVKHCTAIDLANINFSRTVLKLTSNKIQKFHDDNGKNT